MMKKLINFLKKVRNDKCTKSNQSSDIADQDSMTSWFAALQIFPKFHFFSFSGSTWKAIIRCHTNFKPSRSSKNRFTKIKNQAKESQGGGWNGRISSMGILINIYISGLSGHFVSGTLSNITSGVIKFQLILFLSRGRSHLHRQKFGILYLFSPSVYVDCG